MNQQHLPSNHREPAPEPTGLDPVTPSALRRIFVGTDGLRAGWSLVLFLTFLSLLLLLFGIDPRSFFFPSTLSAPSRAINVAESAFSEAVTLVCVVVSTFLMARIERRPMRAFGIGASRRALPQLLAGLAWGATLLSVLAAFLSAARLLVFTGRILFGAAMLRFACEWFLVFLLVALFEEYGLRGYLQFTLARGLTGAIRATGGSPSAKAIGFWSAAALLSVLFGLWHHTNPGESPLGLASAGLIGLLLCLSLWRTGSLWWALGFHAAWDWAQSFLYGVADSGTVIRYHLLASHPAGTPLLSGGRTGPEGSLYILLLVPLIAAVILLTLRPTGWPTSNSQTPSLDRD